MLQLDEVNQAAAEGKKPAFGVHLDIASYGDMSSFFWAHSQPPPPGLIECDVAYGEPPLSTILSRCTLLRQSRFLTALQCILVFRQKGSCAVCMGQSADSDLLCRIAQLP